MRLFFIITTLLVLSIFAGCNSENRNNSRAYVEGKMTGNQVDYNKILVSLKSDGKIIAEATPSGSGQFVVSGPLLSESFSLISNKKIKSFTASKSGCTLSADALEIQIPAGTTYLTFNEIILE